MQQSPEMNPSDRRTPPDGEAATLLALGLRIENPPEAAWPTVEELDELLDSYEVQGIVGQGAMGLVFRARHVKLDRPVAIKVLSPALACEPSFAERLTREATTLARLDHPGIVRIHDCEQAGDLFYLVMEYVDGPNLRTLSQSMMRPEEVVGVALQLFGALRIAHAQGIVHRDIKPENILVTPEARVKLADFGLAKLASSLESHAALTQSRWAVGTPNYMAPEQLRAPDTVDTSADIYALGVVLYELVAGQLPIGRFPPPSAVAPSPIDPRLDAIILGCLEHDPSRRPTAETLASELAQLRSAAPSTELAHAGPAGDPVIGTPSEWAIMRDALASTPSDEKLGEKAESQAKARRPSKALLHVLMATVLPVVVIGGTFLGTAYLTTVVHSVAPAEPEPESDPLGVLARLGTPDHAGSCSSRPSASDRLEIEIGDAPVLGNPDAAVKLVVWSDYECPFSEKLYRGTFEPLFRRYGNDIAVVHKHHPLAMHDGAFDKAVFAEAARRQGKFWEAHTSLFAEKGTWTSVRLDELARELELDRERLDADMRDPELLARVRNDEEQACELGVRGTPGTSINGRFVSGVQPSSIFAVIIEEELARVSD